MKKELGPIIQVTEDGDEVGSARLCSEQAHQLLVKLNETNNYVTLEFTSRLAMYDFAVSLLQEAVYGLSGTKEFYPMEINGKLQVIDGVRMALGSPRLFVSCSDKLLAQKGE